MKYAVINISLLLLLSLCAQAQKVTVQAPDTVRSKKFLPTGVRLGTDVLSLIRNNYDETFEGWEINADVDFSRFYLGVDYGTWGRTFIPEGGFYTNDGNYWRVGIDVNFLTKDPDKNMFFIGARYGRSTFSEQLMINKIDSTFGPINENLSHSNVKGNWFELTTGIRVKIWKVIWMGYTARFKFGLSTNATGELVPSDVPGYGRADKESYWGFNYQIFVRLPVRKDR